MSYRPTIGGRLREEASGVDRSQAACCFEANDLVKEIGQTCGLNVIMRRRATSNRSVVTAAKLAYSTWEIQPGERNGKTLHRNRFAPQPVHLLHSAGKREDLPDRVEAGGSGTVCEEAAAFRRGGGRNHVQHAVVSRRRGAPGGAGSGGRYQSVSRHQPVGEEDRPQRRATVVAVSVEGIAAGGAHER